MIVTVTVDTEEGRRSYTGHEVCSGPRTVDMLLTEPHTMAGRTVQFPLDAVVSRQVHPSTVAASAATR